jgi:hypothetical protein
VNSEPISSKGLTFSVFDDESPFLAHPFEAGLHNVGKMEREEGAKALMEYFFCDS